MRPDVGSSRRTSRRASVDLPQPDSPTMPSVSPRRRRERHAGHRRQHLPGAAHRVLPGQVGGDEQRLGRSLMLRPPSCASHAPRRPRSGRRATQQAARLPARSVSGGISARQRSTAYGQRGANGHPPGILDGSGGEPGICRSGWRSSPLHRRDRRQQTGRVRVLGSGEHRRGRSFLDDVAGVHHEHPLGHPGDDAEVVGDPHDRPSTSARGAGRRGR